MQSRNKREGKFFLKVKCSVIKKQLKTGFWVEKPCKQLNGKILRHNNRDIGIRNYHKADE